MSLRDIARRLIESFDRACCDVCDAPAVRQGAGQALTWKLTANGFESVGIAP